MAKSVVMLPLILSKGSFQAYLSVDFIRRCYLKIFYNFSSKAINDTTILIFAIIIINIMFININQKNLFSKMM